MYFVCALAPGVAFAFGDGVAALCGMATAHASAASSHHDTGTAHHDHAQHMHGHAAHATTSDVAISADPADKADKSGNIDKADKMCCGLACTGALPAAFEAVSLPDLTAAKELPLLSQALAAMTPARLYKPPIV
jgi:hypothetical protein